jgi:hypothetical protein
MNSSNITIINDNEASLTKAEIINLIENANNKLKN